MELEVSSVQNRVRKEMETAAGLQELTEKVTLRNFMRIERSLDCDPFLTARKIRNGVAMNTARILFVCSCSFKS